MEQSLTKQLRHVAHLQAPHQIETVDFHRSNADRELGGDLSVCHPLRYETQNLLLTGREPAASSSFFRRLRSARFFGLGRFGHNRLPVTLLPIQSNRGRTVCK